MAPIFLYINTTTPFKYNIDGILSGLASPAFCAYTSEVAATEHACPLVDPGWIHVVQMTHPLFQNWIKKLKK